MQEHNTRPQTYDDATVPHLWVPFEVDRDYLDWLDSLPDDIERPEPLVQRQQFGGERTHTLIPEWDDHDWDPQGYDDGEFDTAAPHEDDTTPNLAKALASTVALLTPRQRDIAEMLGAGASLREIAAQFGITYSAVHRHLHLIKRKLLRNPAVVEHIATWRNVKPPRRPARSTFTSTMDMPESEVVDPGGKVLKRRRRLEGDEVRKWAIAMADSRAMEAWESRGFISGPPDDRRNPYAFNEGDGRQHDLPLLEYAPPRDDRPGWVSWQTLDHDSDRDVGRVPPHRCGLYCKSPSVEANGPECIPIAFASVRYAPQLKNALRLAYRVPGGDQRRLQETAGSHAAKSGFTGSPSQSA